MKAPKPIIVKSVAGTVAASVLASSCSSDFNFDDCYYGPHADNLTCGVSFIDLNESNLSTEFLYRLNAIQQIIETVLTDKKEARMFAKNPEEYVDSKELHFNLSLDEAERRLLLAFSDNDILNAVKERDIERFLSLCSEKGYIGIINEYNKPVDVRSMFKDDEEYESFLKLVEDINGSYLSTRALPGVTVVAVAGYLFYLGAAVLYAVAGAVTALADLLVGVNVGVAINESVSVNEMTYVNSETNSLRSTLNEREQVLKIWTENNGLIASDVFYTELIEKQVNMFVEIIEKEFLISSDTSDAIRNVLRIQLEGYYGLRK